MSGEREMICISCPVGCVLRVREEDGNILVTGNSCKRGEAYGISEYSAPVRMVTGLMRVEGASRPLPVRLSAPVAKAAIGAVLAEIALAIAPEHSRMYDVLIENVADSGADVIATADAYY